MAVCTHATACEYPYDTNLDLTRMLEFGCVYVVAGVKEILFIAGVEASPFNIQQIYVHKVSSIREC